MQSRTVYVLQLQNNKFYIGSTFQNVNSRFQQHISGQGSLFTKLNKPLKILETIPNADELEEDRTTKKFLFKYGINSTRGGSYVLPKLTKSQLTTLKQEYCTAKNLCFRCMGTHFIHQCKNKNVEFTNEESSSTELEEVSLDSIPKIETNIVKENSSSSTSSNSSTSSIPEVQQYLQIPLPAGSTYKYYFFNEDQYNCLFCSKTFVSEKDLFYHECEKGCCGCDIQ